MSEHEETAVVTCFLHHRGEVLLLRRSERVGSYRGRWGAVAGHAEGDPEGAARREIAEETGLGGAVTPVRRGEPFAVEDDELGKRWLVHPFLFDCASRDVTLDWESTAAEWVPPSEILRRETVPALWTSWRRVAPTVETVAGDREHGSAAISLAALGALADRAGELAAGDRSAAAAWPELAELARELLAARPAMAALANRVHRVMHAAASSAGGPPSPAAVERAAIDGIRAAVAADDHAAEQAAERLAGRTVLTLSRSGTVTAALTSARPRPRVVVAASLPAGEGIGVAERLAAAGLEVELVPDAAVAWALAERRVEVLLVGADTVLPSGGVVNKTGTRPAALAARQAGAQVLAVAAVDKVAVDEAWQPETGEPAELYTGDAPLGVFNPPFELTPAVLFDALICERGAVEPGAVAALAAELRALRGWDR